VCNRDILNTPTPTIILTRDTLSVTPLGVSGDNLLIGTDDLLATEHTTPLIGALPDLTEYHSYIPLELYSPYGAIRVLTPVLMSKYMVLLSYSEIPIFEVGMVFPLDSRYEMCIKHFVCGHLLRDDKESQDISLGNSELSLYRKCVEDAIKTEDTINDDIVELDTDYVYTIPYKGAF